MSQQRSERAGRTTRWQLVDSLTSRFRWSDPLTKQQRQVYDFLTATDIEAGSAAELFHQFKHSEQWVRSPDGVTTESEFRRVLDQLIADGWIEADLRISTDADPAARPSEP